MQNKPRLRPPDFALSDFYRSDCVFNSRSSFRDFGGLSKDVPAADFSTGLPLHINGTLSVICSAAVCSSRTKRLFDASGIPDVTHTITYDSETDYESVLADCRRRQKPVIVQYPETRPRSRYWIDPHLLEELNDKACLPEFVPAPYLPERTVLPVEELPKFLSRTSNWPCVLKGAANLPAGGGPGVAIIRTAQDLKTACDRPKFVDRIVAEEFLTIEDHYCVNYATDGRQTFLLGYCDRIADEAGRCAGHWISLVRHPPREVIEAGFEIMRRAADRGYVGVAGFEIVRDRRGRILVIDLKFRIDEPAAALIWQNRLLSRSGSKCVGRAIGWKFQQRIDPDLCLLQQLIESGWFFPLAIYDPQAGPYRYAEVRVMGILCGSSRYQVNHRLEKLHRTFRVSDEAAKDSGTKTRAA